MFSELSVIKSNNPRLVVYTKQTIFTR